MVLTPDSIIAFQEKILTWYAANGRDLPWRHTRDPYKIVVSEVMSQQTQLSRVVLKYEAWLERFPTVYALASAQASDVLVAWSGLGYNKRALNLQRLSHIVVDELSGRFPTQVNQLLRLPGIGVYTASAVACFAFNAQIAVIDTNIKKVITHEFFEGVMPDEEVIKKVAFELLPMDKAYAWNQALMDYSSLILKNRKMPLKKQSPFHGSNRYYRGQIIKLLVKVHTMSFFELQDRFLEDNTIDRDRLENILQRMAREGLIRYAPGVISLP